MNPEAQKNIASIVEAVVAQFTGGEVLSSFRIERRLDGLTTTPDKSGNYNGHNERNNTTTQKRNNAPVVIGLEGAFGPIDLSRFRSFPDKADVHTAGDYMTKLVPQQQNRIE